MKVTAHWLYTAVPLTAVFLSLAWLASAAWIPAKAELAQWLIARSWMESAEGRPATPPWPWADTRPVGVLAIPALDEEYFILEGNSGRNLAFGPVLHGGTLELGDIVISGHRDTHFSFLARLRPGQRIHLLTNEGNRYFEVTERQVVDSRQTELLLEPGLERLSLVTCYPFNGSPGGPLRYVVTALPVSPRSSSSG